jgi:hypothetical protein
METPFVSFERCKRTGYQALASSLTGKERGRAATTSFSCHRKINPFTNLHYVQY